MVGVNEVKVFHLGEETGLTVYDASYLWLALEWRISIVTFDEQVRGAAAAMGVRAHS
jgi:predicted nucleic acid-binding protein